MSAKTKGFLLCCLAGLLLKPPIAIGDISPTEVAKMNNPKEFLHTLVNEKDYKILTKIIRAESNFDPEALSPTRDYGLCQINKDSWDKELSLMNLDYKHNWKHNLIACVYIYEKHGTSPWNASRKNWEKL